ncbi:MAG: cytochrome c, partial [Nitrospirales bacterium]
SKLVSRWSVSCCRGKWCWQMIPQTMRSMESVDRTYCLNCHGAKCLGNGPVADSLTPRLADLTSEMLQKKTEEEFLKIIREGKSETTMPCWKGE